MQVAEIFDSIEGESFNAGKLSTFVRFSGCNLKCKYCDTKWANKEKGLKMTKEEIVDMLRNTINVTLTGGEPLLQPNLKEFLIYASRILPQLNFNVETNGSLSIQPYQQLAIRKNGKLRYSMDYKFGQKFEESNLKFLDERDSLKFILENIDQYTEFVNLWEKLEKYPRIQIFLSPCFKKVAPERIVFWMKETNKALFGSQRKRFNEQVRLQLQMHKFIWPVNKKGV